MMIIRFLCAKCADDLAKNMGTYGEINTPMPVERFSDDGHYEITCSKGHKTFASLQNIKFELLFEQGLNALLDDYRRDAVSSFASSLERFYEFYWLVVMNQFSISDETVLKSRKILANHSERELGGFISASLLLTQKIPVVLNEKNISFRNRVIHKGYTPSLKEAKEFGEILMQIITNHLEDLRRLAPRALKETFNKLLPLEFKEEDHPNDFILKVNLLTTIDVMNPPNILLGDNRIGSIDSQIARISKEREPKRFIMGTKEELKKRFNVDFD